LTFPLEDCSVFGNFVITLMITADVMFIEWHVLGENHCTICVTYYNTFKTHTRRTFKTQIGV